MFKKLYRIRIFIVGCSSHGYLFRTLTRSLRSHLYISTITVSCLCPSSTTCNSYSIRITFALNWTQLCGYRQIFCSWYNPKICIIYILKHTKYSFKNNKHDKILKTCTKNLENKVIKFIHNFPNHLHFHCNIR